MEPMTTSNRKNKMSPQRDFSDWSKAKPPKAGQGLFAAELEAKHGQPEPKEKVRGGKLRSKSGSVTTITGAEAAAIAAKYMATQTGAL